MILCSYICLKMSKTTPRNLNPEVFERVAHVLKTIGHPVRLGILEVLELDEPLSVREIQARLRQKTEQSLLSHHLIKMKDNGLLVCHKSGKEVHYSLKDRHLLKIFDCLENTDLM